MTKTKTTMIKRTVGDVVSEVETEYYEVGIGEMEKVLREIAKGRDEKSLREELIKNSKW